MTDYSRPTMPHVEFPERFRMGDYFLYHNVEEGREGKV